MMEDIVQTQKKPYLLMEMINIMDTKKTITVQAVIKAPLEKVWTFWTAPLHVTKWNYASDDWHTPRAENDLRIGGKFLY